MLFHLISRRFVVLLNGRGDGLHKGSGLKRDSNICRKSYKFGGLKKNPIKICGGAVAVSDLVAQ